MDDLVSPGSVDRGMGSVGAVLSGEVCLGMGLGSPDPYSASVRRACSLEVFFGSVVS